MIDWTTERLIGLADAATALGKDRQNGYCQLLRWCSRGIDGTRLECLAEGSRLATSVEAIGRFFARLTAKRLRAAGRLDEALAELAAAGLAADGQPGPPATLPNAKATSLRELDEWLGPRRTRPEPMGAHA